MVAGQIGRDGIEPRFERAIATRRRLAKHTQEGFLGQILSKRPIRPHQPIEVTGEHRLISLDKESQGSHFSCYHLLKELLIAQPLHVCPFFLVCFCSSLKRANRAKGWRGPDASSLMEVHRRWLALPRPGPSQADHSASGKIRPVEKGKSQIILSAGRQRRQDHLQL